MSEEKQEKIIKVIGNEIYFHVEVTDESVSEFILELRKLDLEMRSKFTDPTIRIYFNSPGGDLHSGLAAHDHIANCKSRVITVATGLTASAAAIMFLGGHERQIQRNAWILIHQMSSDVWGSFNEMKAEVENCALLMQQMRGLCKKYTSLSDEKIAELMTKDVLLSAKKCIKYGVASKICVD
jgi:ATP-dependent Clp endopeptidase proteolytic subunit ClpP